MRDKGFYWLRLVGDLTPYIGEWEPRISSFFLNGSDQPWTEPEVEWVGPRIPDVVIFTPEGMVQ